MKRFVALVLLAGCQDSIETPFPPGLEPIEDNPIAPLPDGPYDETLRIESDDSDILKVYARGFVAVPFETMWTIAKDAEPNKSTCRTDEQHITLANEPQYEFSFLVHYVVHDFLTVQWDDQWRFGRIDDPQGTTFGMVKHQKVEGSDFIKSSVGTIQVLPTLDPNVTELVFVEHLDAVVATIGDVVQGVQHNYDALAATAHGTPIPPCP